MQAGKHFVCQHDEDKEGSLHLAGIVLDSVSVPEKTLTGGRETLK